MACPFSWNVRRNISLLVWLMGICLMVNGRPVAAQESTGTVPLPGVVDQNTIGDYESNSPYTPVVNFSGLTPPYSSFGDNCDPLVFAPNMFGTITRAPRIIYESTLIIPSVRFQTYALFATPNNGQPSPLAFYEGFPGDTALTLDLINSLPPVRLGTPIGPIVATPPGDTIGLVAPLDVSQTTQLILDNPAVNAAALTQALPGEIMFFNPLTSVATQAAGGGEEENAVYNIEYSYIYAFLGILNFQLGLPNPVDGGIVGRTLVSSNASPLPRDRVLYDYDYLSSAQLTQQGVNLQRHSFGVEKTFFGGFSSITLRLPFASTLDTNIVQNATQSTATSLGNVQIDLKTILKMRETWLVSGGMGISIPTANDVIMRDPSQTTTLARINNDTVVLKPFLAGLWTPNQRFFSQAWMYANFDTMGNPVYIDALGNLTQVGTLNDSTALGFDTQMGYWLISPCESTGWLRGFAPFGELHYITSLQDTDRIQYGNVSIYDAAGRVDEFYATVGATTQIKTNWNATLGLTLPMLPRDNRFSDYNLGLRVNYFFGGTAAARAAGTRMTAY